MWWVQEWHVWVGLGLGVAGLGVGIGAWVYAARANTTAGKVKDEVDAFKGELEKRLEQERELVETEPVVPKRASLGLGGTADGSMTITNYGEGTAHDVTLESASLWITLLGKASWSKIEAGASVPFTPQFLSSYSNHADIEASWVENASLERTRRTISVPLTPGSY